MQYIVCQIGGRQYLVKPNDIIEVDRLSDEIKNLSVDKVLLSVDGNKVEVGKPYLKKTVNFEIVETVKKPKIRVATYKAKSNFRKVKGDRREVTKIKLVEESKVVKKA